jgi:uncharacterized protein YggU (UPF0235/DUF167 family)
MRIPIRVKPGSSRTRVGGSHDGALIVSVNARAVDGQATSAALKALAGALGCRPREIHLVAGATHRTKIVEIPDELGAQVQRLLTEHAGPS